MSIHSKLGVFIGSPFKQLKTIREEVILAILRAGHIPTGMELWSAGVIPTQQAIERYLNRCDIHVIILNTLYGSTIPRKNIGFTEWEYKLSEGIRPVIAFLREDGEFEKERKEILSRAKSRNATEDEKQEARNQARLLRFRKTLKSRAIIQTFTTKGKNRLLSDCVTAINQAIDEGDIKEDAGWIRSTDKYAKELIRINKNRFLQRILSSLYTFNTLTDRVEKESGAKEVCGKLFWDLMYGNIKRQGYTKLFFESGSTIANVSDAFEAKAKEANSDNDSLWDVTTNNSITLLQLLIHTHIKTTRLPIAPAENYYGAIFHPDLYKSPEAPPITPRRLYPTEQAAVESVSDSLTSREEKRLFLATASGLDLMNPILHFRGPHVGSHTNMLFKRGILKTNKPVVLFFTEEKIGQDFETNKCYPVCGPDFPWKATLSSKPLAICTGYSHSNVSEIKSKFKAHLRNLRIKDFDLDYASGIVGDNTAFDAGNTKDTDGVLIFANKQFKSVFPR